MLQTNRKLSQATTLREVVKVKPQQRAKSTKSNGHAEDIQEREQFNRKMYRPAVMQLVSLFYKLHAEQNVEQYATYKGSVFISTITNGEDRSTMVKLDNNYISLGQLLTSFGYDYTKELLALAERGEIGRFRRAYGRGKGGKGFPVGWSVRLLPDEHWSQQRKGNGNAGTFNPGIDYSSAVTSAIKQYKL